MKFKLLRDGKHWCGLRSLSLREIVWRMFITGGLWVPWRIGLYFAQGVPIDYCGVDLDFGGAEWHSSRDRALEDIRKFKKEYELHSTREIYDIKASPYEDIY